MPYIERQITALSDPRVNRPGTTSHVCVQHDRWCGVLFGGSRCVCDQDMLLMDNGKNSNAP